MNAYELADELDKINDIPIETIINMLRQQAERIERKQELIREQTALLAKQNNRIAELEKAQIKELSDEEIYQEMIKCIDSPDDGHEFRYKDFARAILKKASQ